MTRFINLLIYDYFFKRHFILETSSFIYKIKGWEKVCISWMTFAKYKETLQRGYT